VKMPSVSSSNNNGAASLNLRRIGLAGLTALVTSVAWLSLQVRSNYYAKISVSEAVKFAEQVATAVNTYYTERRKFPPTLSEIALPHGEVGYIPNVTIDPASGVLTVVVASTEGKFGTLRYIPNRINYEQLQWRCESVTVAKAYLPPECSS